MSLYLEYHQYGIETLVAELTPTKEKHTQINIFRSVGG